MNRNKAKGTLAETGIVKYLNDRGWFAQRQTLGGRSDRGDIHAHSGDPMDIVVIEVKNRKDLNLPQALRELSMEVDNVRATARPGQDITGVLVVKAYGTTDPGKWFAIQPFAEWLNQQEK